MSIQVNERRGGWMAAVVRGCAAGVLGVGALGVGGCGDEQTMSAVEARAASVPVQDESWSKLGYRLQWRGFATMLPDSTVEFFDVLDDVIAVQESAGLLTVLETSGGQRRWSDQVAGELTKFVGNIRVGNRLLSSSESEVFQYDLETGSLLTRQRLERVVNTRPAVVGDVLVYGTTTGHIIGHLMVNGFTAWGTKLEGAINADPVQVGDEGVLGFVSEGGDVAFVDGTIGFSRSRARMFGGTSAPTGASDQMMFVASVDHSLYGFAADSGSQLWRHRTQAPLRQRPVFHEGRVYCDLGEEGLTALDAITGNVVWSNRDVHGYVVGVRSGRLVVFDGSRGVTLDMARGSVIESAGLSKIAMLKATKFVDGELYAVSANGVVMKLIPR